MGLDWKLYLLMTFVISHILTRLQRRSLEMFCKFVMLPTILLIQSVTCQLMMPQDEVGDHLNSRLRHYIKRLELVAQKTNVTFITELNNLMEKFKHVLALESNQEKYDLLEEYTKLPDYTDYLAAELDKQFLDEDILMEIWYLSEISHDVGKELQDDIQQLIHNLKKAYHNGDVEDKFIIFNGIGEHLSEEFQSYFYGEDEPVPLLNAQLKYYSEYLQYLQKECQGGGCEFESMLAGLLDTVEKAIVGIDKTEKQNVIHGFDDASTKFGRYLNEHAIDFKMFKFGE